MYSKLDFFFTDFYQPVRFGLLQSAVLAKALNLTVPGRFILTRVGNVTLVTKIMNLFMHICDLHAYLFTLNLKVKLNPPMLISNQ